MNTLSSLLYFIGENLMDDAVDVSSKFQWATGLPWQGMVKQAWQIGDMVFFTLEARAVNPFSTNQAYTFAILSEGYRPSLIHFATGHTTDMNYNPKGIVAGLIQTNGNIDVRMSAPSSDGSYVFLSGFFRIAPSA